MKTYAFRGFSILLFCFILLSCKSPLKNELWSMTSPPTTKGFHTKAHTKYLTDPLKFSPIPDQAVFEDKTAVVGSLVCMFYPHAKVNTQEDCEKLPQGIPVPLGTILPILGNWEKIPRKVYPYNATPDELEASGFFHFQDNWNYFFPTRFQGQNGLVFGADLAGLGATSKDNHFSALLYQTQGKLKEFYPTVGYRPIMTEIINRLETQRLAFQTVNPEEFYWAYSPDDMIGLYPTIDHSHQTMFVTTDLAAHAQHLIFDRFFQHLEEYYFFPDLKSSALLS